MVVVVLLACVLVGGLELFAVVRIRRLQEDNAELRRQLTRQDQSFDGRIATERRESSTHLDDGLSELRTAVESSQAAKLDQLAKSVEVRVGEVERSIPVLEDNETITDLGSTVAGLEARVVEAVESLRGLANDHKGQVNEALQRLDAVEQRPTEIGDVAGLTTSLDDLGKSVRAVEEWNRRLSKHVVRLLDTEDAVSLGADVRGARIVHGALWAEPGPVADVLPLLFADLVTVSGGTIRLMRGEDGGIRYLMTYEDPDRLEETWVNALSERWSQLSKDAPLPDDPVIRSLRALINGLDRGGLAFVRAGPLVMARTDRFFGCGVLDDRTMLGVDIDAWMRDPRSVPASAGGSGNTPRDLVRTSCPVITSRVGGECPLFARKSFELLRAIRVLGRRGLREHHVGNRGVFRQRPSGLHPECSLVLVVRLLRGPCQGVPWRDPIPAWDPLEPGRCIVGRLRQHSPVRRAGTVRIAHGLELGRLIGEVVDREVRAQPGIHHFVKSAVSRSWPSPGSTRMSSTSSVSASSIVAASTTSSTWADSTRSGDVAGATHCSARRSGFSKRAMRPMVLRPHRSVQRSRSKRALHVHAS
jgi:hypothetical protein